MKICAVICEFNPFHNGHRYILHNLREQGATHIVCIISGNYTQRAFPAMFPKEQRTKTALLGGADLVIELPLPYAVDTADRFAFGGAEIIKALGCVDCVGFGVENSDINTLISTAKTLLTGEFSEKLRVYLQEGIPFAGARQRALGDFSHLYAETVETPNNILAIEYIKYLYDSDIGFLPVKRIGAGHNSKNLYGNFSSASNIRNNWGKGFITDVMPDFAFDIYKDCEKKGEIFTDYSKFELIMLSRLRTLSKDDIAKLPNVSEGLENRFLSAIDGSTSLEELYSRVKSKRYSHSRIRRIALCGFLGITEEYSKEEPPYIRILGMNERGGEILSLMKKKASLPISHSLKRLENVNENCKRFARIEVSSTNQYNLLLDCPKPCGTDYSNGIVKI